MDQNPPSNEELASFEGLPYQPGGKYRSFLCRRRIADLFGPETCWIGRSSSLQKPQPSRKRFGSSISTCLASCLPRMLADVWSEQSPTVTSGGSCSTAPPSAIKWQPASTAISFGPAPAHPANRSSSSSIS